MSGLFPDDLPSAPMTVAEQAELGMKMMRAWAGIEADAEAWNKLNQHKRLSREEWEARTGFKVIDGEKR
jgi:hypothetical protein